MTKQIFKYPLPNGINLITVPKRAKVLYVGFDEKINQPCIWIIGNQKLDKESRKYEVFITGEHIEYNDDDNRKYIGTVQTPQSQDVYHVFEQFKR